MARGKKKENALTPEEKLAQALVPESEQPYQVPENWCWTSFESISHIRTGKKDANYGNFDGKYPFFTCAAEPIRCDGYSFDCNAILLAGNGDINNISKYAGKFEAYQRTYVVEIHQPINTDLLYYYFKYRWFDYNKDKMFGTAIPYIRLGNLQTFPIPLPPLPEQQRIVDCIESLFAKLDEAKEKAQSVLDSFETRKAAILHKAFTGELTAKWRAEQSVAQDGWRLTTIGKESLLITKGASPRWQGVTYTDDKTKTLFVTSENVREGYLDLSKEKYLDNKINEIQKRSILKKGDVLVNIVGASIGRAAIFEMECLANTNQAVCLIRVRETVANRFLCYYLNSPAALAYYGENKVETARANISLTNISDMDITLPTVEEQSEIVRILDSLFAKEQQAKEAAEAVLEKIDLLKKSILARAFRGELGTNDPSEESAIELLKEVLQ